MAAEESWHAMTRRERHLNIIASWGNFAFRDGLLRYEFDGLIAAFGLRALNDEAVRELATRLIRSRARHNRMNAENRKRREATLRAWRNRMNAENRRRREARGDEVMPPATPDNPRDIHFVGKKP
jgi:hypothetical protein